MCMVQAHWFKDTYIVRFSLIIYSHSLLYILGHGVTIVTSYCAIVMSDTIVAPEWHFYQTIVQYDVTIVKYDVIIVAPWQRTILEILPSQYGILSQYAPLLKVMWPGIDQSALSIYIWHIIKVNIESIQKLIVNKKNIFINTL